MSLQRKLLMITAKLGFFRLCTLNVSWWVGAIREHDSTVSDDFGGGGFGQTINSQAAKTQIGDVIDGRYIVKDELNFLPIAYGAPISRELESSVLEASQTKGDIDGLQTSEVLIDGWQTSKVLGAGAYGRAYLVADKHNPGKDLVLKELLDCSNDWQRQSTYKECKMMQDMHQETYVAQDKVGASRILKCLDLHIDLNLPSILPSIRLDNGGLGKARRKATCPNRQYIITEFGGRPLRLEELKYEGAILKQMLQGVRYMANLGYSHRDLKPDNVLIQYVQDTPIVKIIDFGLMTKDWTCRNGRHGDCSVQFAGYHWTPPEIQRGLTSLQNYFPYMVPDAYDVWSVGLIMVDQVCPETKVSDPVLQQERRRQWALLKNGLSEQSDYAAFFCGTDGSKDVGTEQTYKGFWPSICGISCEEFYSNKALIGIDLVIGAALQKDPQLRNGYGRLQTAENLKVLKVAQETVYVPESVNNEKILVLKDQDTFQARDPRGRGGSVAYRRSKDLNDRIIFGEGLKFGAEVTGSSDGQWVETKAYIPRLGSASLLRFVCLYKTYMLDGGKLVPDNEDYDHGFEACM